MLFMIALLATLLSGWYGHQYWRLAADGATAPALSVKLERQLVVGKSVVGDPYRYYADYTFADAEGRTHSARRTIGRDLYDRLSRSGAPPVTVHYSRSAPDVNVIDLEAARIVPLILAALAAATWIAALLRLIRGG